MAFKLDELPYAYDSLEPAISSRTLEIHHGKHHQGYIDKLNKAISDTDYADYDLPKIIQASHEAGDDKVFRNAAQAWNHAFLWQSMSPNGGGVPTGPMADLIATSFGDYSDFTDKFRSAARSQFGSGWVWLTYDSGLLQIESTGNADTPIMNGKQPLLTLDVWEHAYYLDYQNERVQYIDVFLNELLDWTSAAAKLEKNNEAA